MNSLQQLNTFGNTFVTFTDDRARAVTLATATDLTATAPQNATWGAPTGSNGVISAQSVSASCTFTIDVGVTGATVVWPNSLPAGTAYSNPSTGVYKITGPITKGVWDSIKVHNVTYPIGYATGNTITYTLDLLSGDSRTWDVVVTIEAVYQLGTSATYDEDNRIVVYDIGGDAIADPLIVDTSSGGKVYTTRFKQTSPTDQLGYFASSANTTPVLGNVVSTGNVTVINDSEVFYTPPADYTGSVSILYEQWRYDTSSTANVHQVTNHVISVTNTGVHDEYSLPITNSYATTNPSSSFPMYNNYQGNIQITDVNAASTPQFSPTKTYSVVVENIGTIAGNFSVGNVSIGNPGTISGNITTVNTDLEALKFVPTVALSSNSPVTGFALEYTQTQTEDDIVQADQVVANITLNMPPVLVLGTLYPEFGGIYVGQKIYNSGSYQEVGTWELFMHPTDLTFEDGGKTGVFRRYMSSLGESSSSDLDDDYYSLHNGKELQALADADGVVDTEWGVSGGVTYYRYSAFKMCKNLTAYGYSDYYLPAIEELLLASAYTDLASAKTEEYWSSSPESFASIQQWMMDSSITSPFPWEDQLSTTKSFGNRAVAFRRILTYAGA